MLPEGLSSQEVKPDSGQRQVLPGTEEAAGPALVRLLSSRLLQRKQLSASFPL